MNAWADVEGFDTDDLSVLVARAHEFGTRAHATPLAPFTAAAFLGIDKSRVAMALVCAATTDLGVRAIRDREEWVLSGDAGATPWGDIASTLLIAASTEPSSSSTSLGLFVIDAAHDGVERTSRTSVGFGAMSHVVLAGVRVAASARIDATWPTIESTLDKATIVAGAELAGLARGALDAAVAYATVREQFGAPIATYQALAHRLADMAIDTDAAELAVEEAVDAPTPENVSRAKIIANEAGHRVTAGLHQINGGVGFYADQSPPAYYARALALRVEMGDSATHRLRLTRHLAYPARGS